jgi:two-component system chemotaxis response regulator CheB
MPRILVVDDSALMRRLLSGVLLEAGYAVETARTGSEGVERLAEWHPDVVTLDINMPEMDGLTALSLMMQARPTPVIMVSSLTAQGAAATFEALALGAVDYITKPGGTISLSIDDIRNELLAKVKAAAKSRPRGLVRRPPPAPTGEATPPAVAQRPRPVGPIAAAQAAASAAAAATRPAGRALAGLVVVGVSTGGPRTLEDILPALPATLPWPVVVAQHMPANFTDAFARRMDRLCALTVREANATLPLEPGHAYIGQGGTDMVIAERLGRLVVQPRPESADYPWHPSVDVLMDSARKLLAPDHLVGVLLTGMGDDGARSMAQLKSEGGRTIAESEESAVVFGMPAELIERGGASAVLPAHRVARQLCTWLGH